MKNYKSNILFIVLFFSIISCSDYQANTNFLVSPNEIQIDDLILEPEQIMSEDLKLYFPEHFNKIYRNVEPLGVVENSVLTWPNGRVYFRFANNISRAIRDTILNVCNSFSSFSSIQCIEDINRRFHSVNVTIGNSECSGYSSLGYKPGQSQVLHLNLQCTPNDLMNYLIPHELLHTLGISHEHQQPDRDQHLRINTSFIAPGRGHNFARINSSSRRTSFDVRSIMMYTSFSFARQNSAGQYHFSLLKRSATCDRVPSNALIQNIPRDCVLGSNRGLSIYDKALISHLYK